jgi:hypothetical protein
MIPKSLLLSYLAVQFPGFGPFPTSSPQHAPVAPAYQHTVHAENDAPYTAESYAALLAPEMDGGLTTISTSGDVGLHSNESVGAAAVNKNWVDVS